MKKMDDSLKKNKLKTDDKPEALGLDADNSSEGPSLQARLNDDNDRISGNPDGESDTDEEGIFSPLDDK